MTMKMVVCRGEASGRMLDLGNSNVSEPNVTKLSSAKKTDFVSWHNKGKADKGLEEHRK